jgi:hypothetical protein
VRPQTLSHAWQNYITSKMYIIKRYVFKPENNLCDFQQAFLYSVHVVLLNYFAISGQLSVDSPYNPVQLRYKCIIAE